MSNSTLEDARVNTQTTASRYQSSSGLISKLAAYSIRDFRPWYWVGVPLLAIAAYVTVLRIGFLEDDFVLLYEAMVNGAGLRTLLPLPPPAISLYRPVGMLLTWVLGWQLWGFNPFPYHVISLLIHAAASLVLGLWLANVTSRRALGWLAGALFAVFPLHMQALGWISSQWDTWALLFGLLSLYCFTIWWRGRAHVGWQFYALALLFYGLALFTKESMLTWLPMLALSAWYVTSRMNGATWRKLAYALLPFAAVLALNLGIRFFAWGKLGGYSEIPSNYGEFIWDALVGYGRVLLAPVNTMIFGNSALQIVGVATCALLLVGLTLYGRNQRRLLLLAVAWIILALAPVLHLPIEVTDAENDRFLHTATAGYCVGVAALLYEAIASTRQWRLLAMGLVGMVLVLSIAVCWVQLRPWHTASVRTLEIGKELRLLIPPRPRPKGMVWYVANRPLAYQGIPFFNIGIDRLRYFTEGEVIRLRYFTDNVVFQLNAGTPPINLPSDRGKDAFVMSFKYDQGDTRWHIDNAAGITADTPPPSHSEVGKNLLLWDFRGCQRSALDSWRALGAELSCEPGKGMVLQSSGNDPYIIGPPISLNLAANGARFVRLRVSLQYPPSTQPTGLVNQWFWRGPRTDWSGERSKTLSIKQDGEPHVYWTFLPAADVGQPVSGLRFDPVNEKVDSSVQWIAVDLVPDPYLPAP